MVHDDRLLNDIQARVLANGNWYLWWGLRNIPLRQRLARSFAENAALERLVEETLVRPRLVRRREVQR